jgi:23S rRNA (guanine2445-N2)-methyltransferase / 23S rRNA (guanine2069-N7)-methyltransferase
MSSFRFLVTCGAGIEALVAREIRTLGNSPSIVGLGRVAFEGDAAALVRANLWLRTADRVLLEIARFPAPDFDALFEGIKAIPWADWIPRDGSFPVNARSRQSALTSIPAVQRATKRAVADVLGTAYRAATLPETGAEFAIDVSLDKDEATVTLDTTGASLHKRGYRTSVGKAPLKETLAAALVMLSAWEPGRPLADPFCGSGTIPIEAALMGRGIAPGLRRPFDAEAWPSFPEKLWREARAEAEAAIRPSLEVRLLASDIDPEEIRLATIHARKAGTPADVEFLVRDFRDLRGNREYGCLITNPPYGERLSDQRQAAVLYRSLPSILRHFPTWSHYVLTASRQFEHDVGRAADRRRKLYNGRIECTYYQFFGPKPNASENNGAVSAEPEETQHADHDDAPERVSEPARPSAVFGGLSAKSREQAEIFARLLANRAHHLRRWPTRMGITCYRVYDRDVPEVPLVVDRYEDYLHISEYERPHERAPGEHADWLDLMAQTAAQALEIAPKQVFLKSRVLQEGFRQLAKVAEKERTVIVREGGLRFLINLSDYIDTGLFLDHRVTRGMVREQAAGKRFLNLFGYTGSFSVYAASGGAASTTTVDLSQTYLDWAAHNLRLNEFTSPAHQFVQSDAAAFLVDHPAGEFFDLAVVDPPTYSNSKRTEQDWDVQRDHADLLLQVSRLLSPGGVIYFSTNSRRFHLDEERLAGLSIREISRQTVPPDFRNRRIHRCWRMVK